MEVFYSLHTKSFNKIHFDKFILLMVEIAEVIKKVLANKKTRIFIDEMKIRKRMVKSLFIKRGDGKKLKVVSIKTLSGFCLEKRFLSVGVIENLRKNFVFVQLFSKLKINFDTRKSKNDQSLFVSFDFG